MQNGQLHHIEFYVNDLECSNAFWDWLLKLLGYSPRNTWVNGADWVHPNGAYIVFVRTESPHKEREYYRQAAGLNHIAFCCANSLSQDEWVAMLVQHGARILYNEENYICFEELNGFAVELYFQESRA